MWIFNEDETCFINTSTGHEIRYRHNGRGVGGLFELQYAPMFSKDEYEYERLATFASREEVASEFDKVCAAIKAGQRYFGADNTQQAPEDFYPEFDEIILSGYVDHFTKNQAQLIVYCKRRRSDSSTFAINVPATAGEYFEKADLAEGDYLKVRATTAVWARETILYGVFSSKDILRHERATVLKG